MSYSPTTDLTANIPHNTIFNYSNAFTKIPSLCGFHNHNIQMSIYEIDNTMVNILWKPLETINTNHRLYLTYIAIGY